MNRVWRVPLGLLLAYAVYSPTYAATSDYIVGTIRDNTTFLQVCAAIWGVRRFFCHRGAVVQGRFF